MRTAESCFQCSHIIKSVSNPLEGLGQAWLARAQHSLARIHREEGSSSSGMSGSRTGIATGSVTYTSSDEARDIARAAVEADARLHTSDYVEARGILLPSTEYFSRAVDMADRIGTQSGDLLALVCCGFHDLATKLKAISDIFDRPLRRS